MSKDQDIAVLPGDIVAVSTPGGGGYGDPFRREPQLVFHDINYGYYTVQDAKKLFGVALTADNSDVDERATERIRNK